MGGRNLGADEIAEIRARIAAGESTKVVAADIGCTTVTVLAYTKDLRALMPKQKRKAHNRKDTGYAQELSLTWLRRPLKGDS